MELTMQIQEMVERLGDSEKILIIEILKRFLYDDDTLTEQDKYYIDLAEQEYANGETVSHADIDWS